jgi:toxin ParE1/3/4
VASPVRFRELAVSDIERAAGYYRREASEQTALDFIDATERAIKRIRGNPQVGSLRFAYDLAIPDLRTWPLQRFPYLVFYVAGTDEIDVWRILHARRDIPATLEPPES